GVADVNLAIVVGIQRIDAGVLAATEEVVEESHSIRNTLEFPAVVCIAAAESGKRDLEGSGSTGTLRAAELHHVGGTGGHCKGDLGHEARGSTAIVSNGEFGGELAAPAAQKSRKLVPMPHM
ncbi:MAG: hypothetical protein HOA02_11655, partial [Planctomycetes bacterium]|nr:hypothetical protein [Planctomycetota bacterium]